MNSSVYALEDTTNISYCSETSNSDENHNDKDFDACDRCNKSFSESFEGYCEKCFNHLFPDINSNKNMTKEKMVVRTIIGKFNKLKWMHNRGIKKGGSGRRPDLIAKLSKHRVVVEVDEYGHRQYKRDSEEIRTMLISKDINHERCVFIRFNPDNYCNSNGKKIESCWDKYNGTNEMYVKNNSDWAYRMNVLLSTIQYWINNIPNETITIIKLFYDGWDDNNSHGVENNNNYCNLYKYIPMINNKELINETVVVSGIKDTDDDLYCKVCDYRASTRGNLGIHYQSKKHAICVAETITNDVFNEKVKKYCCGVKKIIEKYKRKQLIKSDYLDVENSLRIQKNSASISSTYLTKTKNDKNYLCTGCGKNFTEINLYKGHIKACIQIETKYNLLTETVVELVIQLKQLQEACNNGIRIFPKSKLKLLKDIKIKDLEERIKNLEEQNTKLQNITVLYDSKCKKLKDTKEKLAVANDKLRTVEIKYKFLKKSLK